MRINPKKIYNRAINFELKVDTGAAVFLNKIIILQVLIDLISGILSDRFSSFNFLLSVPCSLILCNRICQLEDDLMRPYQ